MSDPNFQRPSIAGIEDYHTVKEDSDQIIDLENTFELERILQCVD